MDALGAQPPDRRRLRISTERSRSCSSARRRQAPAPPLGDLARELELISSGPRSVRRPVRARQGQREVHAAEQLRRSSGARGGRRAGGRVNDLRKRSRRRTCRRRRASRPTQLGRLESLRRAPRRRHPHLPRVAGRAAWTRRPRTTSTSRRPQVLDRTLRPREVKTGLEYLGVRSLNPDRGTDPSSSPTRRRQTSLGRSIAKSLAASSTDLRGGVRDEPRSAATAAPTSGPAGDDHPRAARRPRPAPGVPCRRDRQMGADFRGDPSSAMLEVLDPAQNSTPDHYKTSRSPLRRPLYRHRQHPRPIPGPLQDGWR